MKIKKCKYSKKCGGCEFINTFYPKQLELKQVDCKNLLGRFGKIEKIIGMDSPYYYRNKVNRCFQSTKHHKTISGLFKVSTHELVVVEKCLIHDETADKIINKIQELIVRYKLIPFNEKTLKGFLRYVLVRVGKTTNQVLVTLVVGNKIFPKKKEFIEELVREFPMIKSIVVNHNNRFTSMILGRDETVIYGEGYIIDELLGYKFKISSKSFYQVNSEQTAKLYQKAIELANLKKTDTLLDAYSGIGTIGIIASKHVNNVLAFENNKDANQDAITNTKLNKVKNIRFYLSDDDDFFRKNNQNIDVVIMDPPRTGSSIKFINYLFKSKPKRIVYISCNPVTLKRDLHMLSKEYNVKTIVPVDMFPHTRHVESVVLMSRVSNEPRNERV